MHIAIATDWSWLKDLVSMDLVSMDKSGCGPSILIGSRFLQYNIDFELYDLYFLEMARA